MRHDPSFLELIRANLDDDTPRLVYADWLQQKGARYGAFIVASCALEDAERATSFGRFMELRRGPPETQELIELRARVNQLWRKNRKDWLPEPFTQAREVRCRRGFIDHLAIEAGQLSWPLLELAPALTSLELRAPDADLGLDAPVYDQLRFLRVYVDPGASPAPSFPPRDTAVTHLRALSLPQDLGRLSHPRFARLDELSIAGSYDRHAPERLAALPCRPTKLNVAHVTIGDAGWRSLAHWLAGMDVLNARDTGTTSDALFAHLNPDVRALDLSGNPLDETAVKGLCSSLRRVEFLDVRGCFKPSSPHRETLRDTFGERVIV